MGTESSSAASEYKRIFAVLEDGTTEAEVVKKAVGEALRCGAHLRFGYVAHGEALPLGESLKDFAEEETRRIGSLVEAQVAALDPAGDLDGGELEVMPYGGECCVQIDEAVGTANGQMAEELIEPFCPDLVLCGLPEGSRLTRFLKSNTYRYLKRNLHCPVLGVS